jgi:ubiquinone biosynthesis protein
VLVRLFSIARQFNMEIQPQLVLLEKTLLNIEGLGRQLYPELDLWQTAQPVLREWMAERSGPKALINRVRQELPEIRYLLDQLPSVARRLVDDLNQPDSTPTQEPPRSGLSAQGYYAFCGTIMLLAATGLIGFQVEPGWLGWSLGALGLGVLYKGRPAL